MNTIGHEVTCGYQLTRRPKDGDGVAGGARAPRSARYGSSLQPSRELLLLICCRCSSRRVKAQRPIAASPTRGNRHHLIVGMTYSAPARMPVGQRAVIVLRRV